MRLVVPIAGALLLLVMVPTEAPALKLGHVLERIAVGHLLRHPRRAYRPYAHRARIARRAVASRRAYAQAREYRAAGSQAQMAQGSEAQMRRAMQFTAVQAGAFWPSASQDMFDYLPLSKEAAFWINSSGALVVSTFAKLSAKVGQRGSAEVAASDEVQSTTGTAASESVERICGEHSASGIDAMTEQLRGLVAPAADQESSLAALRDALRKADEDIARACPDAIPSDLPERLKAMQDRLWTMRATTTSLRAPLQAFHDSLTNEQKTKLDAPQPSEGESRSVPGNEPAALCYAAAQRAPQWPVDQIARAVRPNKDQQVSLRTLGELSAQMGQLMMASCPRQKPATPSARLDVVVDRLDTMFFATVNMAAALTDFYQSLSDEQKARLDSLSL